jgi:hypothetical protein
LDEWGRNDSIGFPKVLTVFGGSLAWVLVGSGEVLVNSGWFWCVLVRPGGFWGSGQVLVGFWWIVVGSGGVMVVDSGGSW